VDQHEREAFNGWSVKAIISQGFVRRSDSSRHEYCKFKTVFVHEERSRSTSTVFMEQKKEHFQVLSTFERFTGQSVRGTDSCATQGVLRPSRARSRGL
jgi:hypothetical protein